MTGEQKAEAGMQSSAHASSNRVHERTGLPICEFGCFHTPDKSCDCECHATRNRTAEDEWQLTYEKGTVFDLPFYRDGYIAGWRAAMTEAKGGDWSQETPDV